MTSVVKGGDQCEEGGADIDTAFPAEEVIAEGQENEGDGQWIEEHEDRNSRGDDGGETEEGDAEGDDGEDGHPCSVGESGNEFLEIFAAGGDEADAGGEAGEEDDDAHQDAAVAAEVVVRGADQDVCPIFQESQLIDRAGADDGKEDVNDSQAGASDEAALQGMGGDFFIACRAILADCIDDDDAEDETSQGVHGVISIEEALRQCFDGGLIGCLCFLPAAHREECRGDEKDSEEEEKCRGDDFPDAADQFRRADGEPPGDHEKDKGEGIERGLLHRFAEEGRDADRIGGRRCTGDGKSRPDGEIEADGEENGVALVDTGGQ